jgi:ubiquinone/menaquinone biosynthesis C-methylase UbiE
VPFFPWLYDLFMVGAERAGLGDLRAKLVKPAGGRVLEIGAGTGLNFPHYEPDAVVIATDVDAGMLARARERMREASARVLLVTADAERLPFRDSEFEGAVVGLALCTIPHPAVAIEEMRRVMRPGASLYLLEHVRKNTGVSARIQDLATPVWRRIAGGCHLNRRTEETLAAGGFRIEHVDRYAGGILLLITARLFAGQVAKQT